MVTSCGSSSDCVYTQDVVGDHFCKLRVQTPFSALGWAQWLLCSGAKLADSSPATLTPPDPMEKGKSRHGIS